MKKLFSCMLILLCLSCVCVKKTELCTTFASSAHTAPKYDGRETGIITPVRDQGASSLCWAYSAISAAEASILKSGISESVALSPEQLGYVRHNRDADPLSNTIGESTGENWYYATGNSSYAPSLFSQWCAPVSASLAEDCNGFENCAYILKESINLDGATREQIKKAIVKYGAVTFSYNNLRESYYYNPSGETASGAYPHACTIIGWDDTIPAEYFAPGGAKQDGGWLVKNSYSSLPYFYLLYDNNSSNIYAFSFYPRYMYDSNYFYDSDTIDFGLGAILKLKRVANIFTAHEFADITAVNVGIDGANTNLMVKVYTNVSEDPTDGTLMQVQQMSLEYPGYYTVELEKPVRIEKGERFSIVCETEGGHFKITQNSGNSYFNRNGTWEKSPYSPRVKAYTVDKKLYFTGNSVCLNASVSGKLILSTYDNERMTDARIFDVTPGEQSITIPGEYTGTLRAFFWDEKLRPLLVEERE